MLPEQEMDSEKTKSRMALANMFLAIESIPRLPDPVRPPSPDNSCRKWKKKRNKRRKEQKAARRRNRT